jgi:hypothetical protein
MTDSTGDTEWQQWLDRSLKAAGIASSSLDALTGGVVTASMRSNWKKGRSGASPTVVVEIANTLGAGAAEALRAAGHHVIADKIAAGNAAAEPGVLRDSFEDRLEGANGMAVEDRQRWLALYRMDVAALRIRYNSLLDLYLNACKDGKSGSADRNGHR